MSFETDKDFLSRINDVENTLVNMGSKIEKIYDVVVGNETFDQVGLIGRLKKVESEIEKLTAIKHKVIGASLVGGATWAIIWEMIKKMMKI
jgi:hypothetical protein